VYHENYIYYSAWIAPTKVTPEIVGVLRPVSRKHLWEHYSFEVDVGELHEEEAGIKKLELNGIDKSGSIALFAIPIEQTVKEMLM